MNAVARPLPALAGPAGERQDAGDARPQRDRLPDLARLHPLVATHRAEPHHGEDGHGQPFRPLAADLGGGGGLALLRKGALVGLHLVGLRPLRAE